MSLTADDLGVLGSLGTAIGFLDASGDPNPSWFGSPEDSLKTMLSDDEQRAALIAFVDEALGGADRTTEDGVVWLPVVSIGDPHIDVYVTVDERPADWIAIGVGIAFTTGTPVSRTTASIPLFRAGRADSSDSMLLLGSIGGRLRLTTSITVNEPEIGSIGLDVDIPTHPDDTAPAFGLTITDLQLPGASAPRDVHVSATGADELDDAVLDLVLSVVKAQATGGGKIAAVAGLLGLGGGAVPDFPIDQLASQGVSALAAWLRDVVETTSSRQAWLDHLATLVEGDRVDDTVKIDVGPATVRVGLLVDTGPSGNVRITPTLAAVVGDDDARAEAVAHLCRIDLVTGEAIALPSLGLWAAVGSAGNPVLDVTDPTVARADTLRVGFALDAGRRLTFVLAADQVRLGTRDYPVLDLTSPDAVMDAAGNAVEDVADELLGNLGDALTTARVLLGLDPPPGHPTVPTISLADLLGDPVAAVAGYWQTLTTSHADAVGAVLLEIRDAIADATEIVGGVIHGTGTAADPWRVPLAGPIGLEVSRTGSVVAIAIAAGTSVDTLGQRCTVIETRLAATLAEIDLGGRTASLLTGVSGRLTARERGVNPPAVTLTLGDGVSLSCGPVGVRLDWTVSGGLSSAIEVPDPALIIGDDVIAVPLPTIAADGSVTLDSAGWDAVQELIGRLAVLLPGTIGDIVALVGWNPRPLVNGAELRLADLVDDPAAALAGWLPEMLLSEFGPDALSFVANLLNAAGDVSGSIAGSGHPDDPYRLSFGTGLPEPAVWFPPAGLAPRSTAVPDALARWRPGDPGLAPEALDHALHDEAQLATDIADMVRGRSIAIGLAAITARWVGGDGRIAPPSTPPGGITVVRAGAAAAQLLPLIDLETELDRVPSTVVFVDIGAGAWPASPAGRRIDLTAPGLAPSMFTPPEAATGEWFVALGTRAACKLASGDADGTAGQAARLGRVLDALAPLGDDLVVVALGGAGHAARVAADAQPAVSDLFLVGTPLGPVSLSALDTQPAADTLRLLHRLLPPTDDADPDDADLALGRQLVDALVSLSALADPAADLRPPSASPPDVRAGLTVSAWFGQVTSAQVARAVTAIVAAGLAERARQRELEPLPATTGVYGGLVFAIPPGSSGTLRVEGDARLTLAGFDRETGIDRARSLRVRVWVSDRLGWLIAAPEQELRFVSVDATIPLGGGAAPASATVTLHDARVLGQSWERLTVGTGLGHVPLLPEARLLVASAVQRLVADAAANAQAAALRDVGLALGLIVNGGAVHDAFDQLVHDATGLVATALSAKRAELSAAITSLLGAIAVGVDLDAKTVTVSAGGADAGPFGWTSELTVAPTSASTPLTGTVTFGPDAAVGAAGGAQVAIGLAPFAAEFRWHQPGGTTDVAVLWPAPDAAQIARLLARAAPSLGAHIALEVMRRADETARPVIDAALDAMGMLAGAAGDAERALRPLAGFLSDPAGWLRSAESIAAQPAKAQVLFDALRPLLGLAGAAGEPLTFSPGVALAVVAEGGAVRLELAADSSAFAAPGGATGRLVGGVTAAVVVGASGPPRPALGLHVGLEGADAGRQAVHVTLGGAGIGVFLRPTTGADIPLVPFAGLGSLAAAAEAALPFLLDRLAEIPGEVGDTVATVGDALAVRTGSGPTRRFDGPALIAWAVDPVGSLTGALPTIISTGLTALAPLVDGIVPSTVDVTATANELTVTIGAVALTWAPAADRVTVTGTDIGVPGIESLSFGVTISPAGIDELTLTIGPAAIDAGGVTLQPFVQVAAGSNPVGGAGVAVGLANDPTHRFAIRWLLDPVSFALVAGDGPLAGIDTDTDPAAVAARIVETVIDVVAAVAISTDAVQDVLQIAIGSSTVGDVLQGVVLDGTGLVDGIFDPLTLLGRVLELFDNLAGADLSVTFEGLTLSLIEQGGVIGLQLGLADRLELFGDDVTLWLENDDSWIDGNPGGTGGIFLGAVTIDGTDLSFTPSLAVNGVGLRVGKLSGPLIDIGVTIESIAFHTFAEIGLGTADVTGAGVQIQFTNLAVAADGASGGNSIAAGIVADTGPQPPKPTFSPALAIQQHDDDPVHITLRAGPGNGPWWIAIQKGFGPLYLEQIGFGAEMPSGRVDSVSLFLDGSVSLFGLTCAVDDLQITYLVSKDDFFNPASWEIDLAGLAVSADMSGVRIAGGLLKSVSPTGDVEYLGMLLGRFGVYGITIYGGYGEGTDPGSGERFVAFFAIGAVVGPIGGPPAFFLTGIGGGFGINRALVVPTDLSTFGEYPLIQALDTAASPGNPMEQLRALGAYFPMEQGTFWFAAGLSFTSFVIVEGIAVVAVEIGDGLDISLLGLARVALPRPEVALVSIELALVVRFSSSEGVLWVQGQLTDNSWLLYRDVKLTGGFAYVIWFKGPHAGEFVLTMGGYHPDFHRDGYPEVPRLGVQWSVSSAIVIKAGGYFALTSEAVMAGGDFEASASFGPAWAEVKFGAHGIVFFDPFHYSVSAYASIAAGVTIDTWLFGEITISISIGARIQVEGPDFHGRATFEVGPIELEVEFGSSDKHIDPPLSPTAFIDKYLDPAPGGGALAITVISTFGAQPSGSGAPTPDGKPDRPFIVVAEFGLILTSVVPATSVVRNSAGSSNLTTHNPSRTLGVAPMDEGAMTPQIALSWIEEDTADNALLTFPFVVTARPFGSFPVGVWGPPQDTDNRPLPKGEVIDALCELELSATATIGAGSPPIPYYQVEINDRRPLPFSRTDDAATLIRTAGTRLSALVTPPTDVSAAFATAGQFLSTTASPTALAALRGERQTPPMIGTLGEGLDTTTNTVIPTIGGLPARRVVDTFVYPATAVALLPASGAVSLGDASRAGARTRTTVKGSAAMWRAMTPTLASVDADRSVSIATGLVIVEPPASPSMRTRRSGTLIPTGDIPPSETARAAPALVATRGSEATRELRAFSAGLRAGRRVSAGTAGAVLGPGDVAVLALPNARRDVDEATDRPLLGVRGNGARLVALADGGRVIDDRRVVDAWPIAQGTERIVAIGLGAPDPERPLSTGGLLGWHAGMQLPYVGWSTAVGSGCTVRSRGEGIRAHRQRAGAGWVAGAELARGTSTVTTRFAAPVTVAVIVLDDPNAFGDARQGRELLLALQGAVRATDASGTPLAPVALTSEQRNVVAYDLVPERGDERDPVTVTVASEDGWSLAGVLGADGLSAESAIAIITARGLDAAVDPVASGGRGLTTLVWRGPTEPGGK